jgi:hypothetical protein
MMTTQKRSIGLVGTLARIVVGFAFLYLALTEFGTPKWDLDWYSVPLGLIVFPAALLLFQAVRLRFTKQTLNATGVLGFCLNFAVGAVLISFDYTRDAALLFYGTSMLLAAARGYAGCEVLAITNWVLRRDDQVGCVLFSPLDEIESKTTGNAAASI